MKTLAHTDLTNPEQYNAVMNFRTKWIEPKIIEKQYDTLMNGIIHTTASDFEISFENGKYWISDKFGNDIYLSNWNNRGKVFDFYAQNSIQFIDNFEEMEIAVARFFKRTNTKYFAQLVKYTTLHTPRLI